MSLSEGFKMIDANFDGVVTLSDLSKFLRDTFGVDTNGLRMKIERLFRILDLGKTGSIYMVDFENMFTKAYLKRGPSKSAEPVVDWKQSCLE
jgi:Ca2+-binding EF-hand superfamily protein